MFGNKYEEASELLEKACNNYKLAKMWREAADAFALLADCHLKCDSKHEAAQAHVEAANANKKVDPAAVIASLRVAISHFTDMGRLSIAAKHLKDIAEQYEKDEKEKISFLFETDQPKTMEMALVVVVFIFLVFIIWGTK